MKGHMENGKFHPHTEYKKGIRKSRDQKEKTQGVKIRKRSDFLNDVAFRVEKDKTFGKREIFTEGFSTAVKTLEEENADRIVNQTTGEVLSKEDIETQRMELKKRERKARNSKLEIRLPKKKGKDDSIFYEGEVARMTAKDGTEFILDAVGSIDLEIDGKPITVSNAEFDFKLNDDRLWELEDKDRLNLIDNNWFEITSKKPDLDYREPESWTEPIESYDSAIGNLEEVVDQYNKGTLKEA